MPSGQCGRVMSDRDGHTDWIWALAALPDGRMLSGAAREDDTLRVWQPNSGACLVVLRMQGGGVAAVLMLPACLVAAACGDGGVRICDADAGAVLRTLQGHGAGVMAVAAAPGTPLRLLSAACDGSVRLWNSDTGACSSPSSRTVGARGAPRCSCLPIRPRPRRRGLARQRAHAEKGSIPYVKRRAVNATRRRRILLKPVQFVRTVRRVRQIARP